METHQSHLSRIDAPDNNKKSFPQCDLCPALASLEAFAKRKYATYQGLAERDDNKQKGFDPLATNFLQASQLMVQAVLRSTQKEMGQS